jgi:hypothetical protein
LRYRCKVSGFSDWKKKNLELVVETQVIETRSGPLTLPQLRPGNAA